MDSTRGEKLLPVKSAGKLQHPFPRCTTIMTVSDPGGPGAVAEGQEETKPVIWIGNRPELPEEAVSRFANGHYKRGVRMVQLHSGTVLAYLFRLD